MQNVCWLLAVALERWGGIAPRWIFDVSGGEMHNAAIRHPESYLKEVTDGGVGGWERFDD